MRNLKKDRFIKWSTISGVFTMLMQTIFIHPKGLNAYENVLLKCVAY